MKDDYFKFSFQIKKNENNDNESNMSGTKKDNFENVNIEEMDKIQKDILNKSKLSVGLNYKYFSTTNKVGSKINSAQANYYAAYSPVNPSKNFHNKFHFLEVPVTFGLRLNPNKSLPLYWNAGISISQLISINALQFRSDRGIYYEDNSFFNKTTI